MARNVSPISASRKDHGSLSRVLTPHNKNRWVHGARLLACAQDMIITDGPAKFVERCLACKPRRRDNTWQGWVGLFMFVFIVPAFTPIIYCLSSMGPVWGMTHIGGTTKFDLVTLKVHLDRLDVAMKSYEHAGQNVTGDSYQLFYIEDQMIQAQMRDPRLAGTMAACTVVFLASVYSVMRYFKKNYYMKGYFMHLVLHSQWYTYADRLKFADQEFFGGLVRLQDLIPCAWFSICVAFIVLVPTWVFFSMLGKVSYDLLLWKLCVKIPGTCIASWLGGKLYLSIVSTSSWYWLFRSPQNTDIIVNQIKTEGGGILMKLVDVYGYYDVCTVAVQDMEYIQSVRTLELWTMCKAYEYSDDPELQEWGQKLRTPIETSNWAEVDKLLHSLQSGSPSSDQQKTASKLEEGQSWSERVEIGKRNYFDACLLKQVFITDNNTDTVFVVDIRNADVEVANAQTFDDVHSMTPQE